MALPSWLLLASGWTIALIGAIALLVVVAFAFLLAYRAMDFVRLEIWWQFKRHRHPDIAIAVDNAEERAREAEDKALRAEADGIFWCRRAFDMEREQHAVDGHTAEWLNLLWFAIDKRGQEKLSELKKRH